MTGPYDPGGRWTRPMEYLQFMGFFKGKQVVHKDPPPKDPLYEKCVRVG